MKGLAITKFGLILFSVLLFSCGGGNNTLPEKPKPEPAIINIIPSDGTAIIKSKSVYITFNEAMDQSSFNDAIFTLINNKTEKSISGKFLFTKNDTKVQFKPLTDLELLANYTIRLQGVKTINGGQLKTPFTSSFDIVDGSWTLRVLPLVTASKNIEPAFQNRLAYQYFTVSNGSRISLLYLERTTGQRGFERYNKSFIKEYFTDWSESVSIYSAPQNNLYNIALLSSDTEVVALYGINSGIASEGERTLIEKRISRSSDFTLSERVSLIDRFYERDASRSYISPNGNILVLYLIGKSGTALSTQIYNGAWQSINPLDTGTLPISSTSNLLHMIPIIFNDGSTLVFFSTSSGTSANDNLMYVRESAGEIVKISQRKIGLDFLQEIIYSVDDKTNKIVIIYKYLDGTFWTRTRLNGQWNNETEIKTIPKGAIVRYLFQYPNDELLVIYGVEDLYQRHVISSTYSSITGWEKSIQIAINTEISTDVVRVNDIVTLIWLDDEGLRSNRYDKKWTGEQTVKYSNPGTVDQEFYSSPKIVTAPDGVIHAFWIKRNPPEIFTAVFK